MKSLDTPPFLINPNQQRWTFNGADFAGKAGELVYAREVPGKKNDAPDFRPRESCTGGCIKCDALNTHH